MVNIEAKWVRNGNTLALLKLIQGNQKKGKKKKSDGFPNKMTGISISNFPYYFNFFLFNQLLLYSYADRKCQMWNLVQS